MSQMIKSGSIYAIGGLARQLMGFLMLPIYTRHLSPADYGVVEMLSVIMSVLAVVAGVHMTQGVYRYHATSNTQEEKNTLISTACHTTFLSTLAVYGVLLAALLTPAGPVIAGTLLSGAENVTLLMLFGLLVIFQPLEEQLFATLRIADRPGIYVSISLAKLCLQLGLNIYFVVYLDLKAAGVVYGAVIATGLCAFGSVLYILFRYGHRFDATRSRQLIAFAIPLAVGGLGSLYMGISDRYALQLLSGSAAVGLYALAYRLADVLGALGWQPFQQVWQTRRYDIYKQENAVDEYQKTFLVLALYLVWMGLGISLLADDVLFYMAAPEFLPAAQVVPPLVLASLFGAMSLFCNFIFFINDKPAVLSRILWGCAVLVTLAYLVLLPAFGQLGAGWARAGAMCVQALLIAYLGGKLFDMQLPLKAGLAVLLLAGAIATLSSLYIAPGWQGALLDMALLAAFPALVILGPLLPASQRAWLQQQIGTRTRALLKRPANP